jgi:hypothetical protein
MTLLQVLLMVLLLHALHHQLEALEVVDGVLIRRLFLVLNAHVLVQDLTRQ